MRDRNAAAKLLQELLPCPVYMDGFDNEATRLYSAFPDKLVIVLDGRVEFISKIGGALSFDVPSMTESLDVLLKNRE